MVARVEMSVVVMTVTFRWKEPPDATSHARRSGPPGGAEFIRRGTAICSVSGREECRLRVRGKFSLNLTGNALGHASMR